MAKKFLSTIRKSRPDLIVFSHIYGAPTILISKSDVPAVYDFHAVELELTMGGSLRSIVVIKILEASSLRLSDKIITLSESDKSFFKLYYNLGDNKLVVIPPPRLNMQCSGEEILAGKQ
ncbi:MAG: glycosyltransferase family 4 protein [Aquificaceae bacterium]